jgi:hypothetical protein
MAPAKTTRARQRVVLSKTYLRSIAWSCGQRHAFPSLLLRVFILAPGGWPQTQTSIVAPHQHPTLTTPFRSGRQTRRHVRSRARLSNYCQLTFQLLSISILPPRQIMIVGTKAFQFTYCILLIWPLILLSIRRGVASGPAAKSPQLSYKCTHLSRPSYCKFPYNIAIRGTVNPPSLFTRNIGGLVVV